MESCRKPWHKKILGLTLILLILLALGAPAYGSYTAGKKAFARKSFESARKQFRKAIANNPNDGNSYFYLGYMDEIERKYASSINQFQKAVSRRMETKLRKLTYWKIINYYKYHQNWEKVYRYSRERLQYGSDKKIEKLLEKAASLRNPNLIAAHRRVKDGKAALADNDYEEAVGHFQAALSLESDLPKVRLQLGLLLQKLGRVQASLSHFEKLVTDFPDNSLYRMRYGLALEKMGRNGDALVQLNKAKSDPKFPKNQRYYLYVLLGKTNLAQGNRKSARRYFRKAIRLRPKSASPRLGLAKLDFAAGKYSKTIKRLKPIVAQRATDPDFQYILGVSYYKQKSKKKAFRHLNELVRILNSKGRTGELSTTFKAALLPLAYLHSYRDSFSKAVYYFDRAATDTSNTREYNFYYGKALFYEGRIDKARPFLEKVPNSPGATFLIAKIYGKKMNRPLAQKYLKIAADKRPRYWSKSKKDPAFTNLLNQDTEFKRFVDFRGKPPKPKPVPKNKSNPFDNEDGIAPINPVPKWP